MFITIGSQYQLVLIQLVTCLDIPVSRCVNQWSRRINEEHRLVYEVRGVKEKGVQIETGELIIYQCKYHY